MTRLGIGASLLLAAAAAAAMIALTSPGTSRASPATRAKCPVHLYTQETRRPDRTAEAVIAAARRQIPLAFRHRWVNQDGVVKLTPFAYDVTAVLAAAGPRSRYFREATGVCGRRVARAS